MALDVSEYDQEPRTIRTPHRWLAISRPEQALRIGVLADTEEAAIASFRERLQAWRRWAEQAAHTG
jgi:hypothetical protein